MTFSIIQKSQLEGAQRIDAEYYQPEYLRLKSLFEGQTLKNHSFFVKKGIFDISPTKYREKGIPLVRVQNIKNGFVEYQNMVYLSDNDHNIEKKTELNPYDIVFSKIGTIGEVALLDPKHSKWNFSQNVIGIKIDHQKISPAYLLFFLISNLGQLQIKRARMGQVQDKLELEDIRNLIVPKVDSKIFENYLSNIMKLKTQSENLYQQAENLLLEELGLKDFDEQNDLFSIVEYGDVIAANRNDAEYFQPKYQRLFEAIKKRNPKKLSDLVSVTKGFEPGSEEYQEAGKLFIRVSSLSKDGIITSDQKYLSDDLYNKLKNNYEPKVGDILLTKDATPGIAYVLKETVEGIISGGILRLKLKQKIDPEYLTLVINSLVGQLQAERDAGGSIIAHWKPEEIKKVVIPVLPQSTQQKIADLVRQSHAARQKSKELLEEAKRKVEEMIETPLSKTTRGEEGGE